MDWLIYFFLLFVIFTAIFTYGYKALSTVGNDTLKIAMKEEIGPVVDNVEKQTDGYLCNFIQTNDKSIYRLEKMYSTDNREYTANNLWLSRVAVLICIFLALVIGITSNRIARPTLNFAIILVSSSIVFYMVFYDDLSQYQHVDKNYVMATVKKDMLSELNK